MITEWSCFCLDLSWHRMTSSTVDALWNYLCSTRKHQSLIGSARPGPRCQGLLPLSQQQYTMPMSLLLCKYIISSHFMYQCFPIPYSLPSRSSASLRDASALLASHGFMMWIQNVFTPGPNPFTAPLVAVSLFWRGQLQSKKCSHRGGMVSNLVLGGKPLILSFPVCSVFWFAFWCSWK